MCGISGFFTSSCTGCETSSRTILKNMSDQLKHRGPDSEGLWCDDDSGIALAHNRLSIIDLTPSGDQPMVSRDGRYVIVFNGEIYNFGDLRALLKDRQVSDLVWKGTSDTEVLLECISLLGLSETLGLANGMFAFACWDRKLRTLVIARDRVGEKPLYYANLGFGQTQTFVFASELRAIEKHPLFNKSIDCYALNLFINLSYIPAPYSIYQQVKKLEPGHYIQISKDPNLNGGFKLKKEVYWDLRSVLPYNASARNLNFKEAKHRVEAAISKAVSSQMVADVPIGAFLSGGIDSSLVVANMQKFSSQPIQTFSIGFAEEDYNEAAYAKKVASFIGTDHTDLYLSQKDVLDTVSILPTIYDEPFADVSQLPTFIVAQLASKSVKVALSGDGGDELFGGYNRYIATKEFWSRIAFLPVPIRKLISASIKMIGPGHISRFLGSIPISLNYPQIGDKIHKGADVLSSRTVGELYSKLVGSNVPYKLVKDTSSDPDHYIADIFDKFSDLSNVSSMMASDTISYLPGDILTKVDRASMAVSLETRVPFLDKNLIELAWCLPEEYKIKNKVGKRILREILYNYIPEKLVDRPKMGFGVPISEWLRRDLKSWAESMLDPVTLKEQGLLNVSNVQLLWNEHISGDRNWHRPLWSIIMFQAWMNRK